MNPEFTIIISTCNKFSDIWDIQCSLIERNWSDRKARTILLTDSPTDYEYENVEVISAGKGLDMVDRLRCVVSTIETKYVFITLDDYFLVKQAQTERINELIQIMKKENLDYMRLYRYPRSRKTRQLECDKNIRLLSFDKRYDVNLYPGIWKKEFLEKTLSVSGQNAWEYEVSLTKTAMAAQAKCAWCTEDIFPILDAIRKGCFLHSSKRFINKHMEYSGIRETISYKEEIRLIIMRLINTYFPDWMRVKMKLLMTKRGKKFYSND